MTSTISRRRLSECSMEDGAEGFMVGFEGYVIPLHVTPRSIELRIERDHVDPDESLVYFDDDKPAGILLIARRGTSSRIGAIGMGPTIRGKGMGRAVMLETIAAARARGDRELILEVMNSNTRARDLYLQLGFTIDRKLVGFARSKRMAAPDVAPAPECPLREAAKMAAAFSDANLTWQTNPVTFERAGPPLKAFSIDGRAVAILDDTSKNVRLFCLAVDPAHRRKGHGRALTDALAAAYPGQKLYIVENVPYGLFDPFMRRIGWRKSRHTQSEMTLNLTIERP